MRVGAIDVGTNSTRLLVAEFPDEGPLRWLEHRVVITRLGQGVDADGRFHPDAVARTLDALLGHREAMDRWAVERFRAVATSATRDAADRETFLSAAGEVLAGPLEVISGEEEARLSFRGVVSSMDATTPVLVIDPGGGSTEFVLGDTDPVWVRSVDIGSVRLTERQLAQRPAAVGDLLAASAAVEELFAALDPPEAPATVVGVGGTFTSLAAIHLDLPTYERLEVHGCRLEAVDLAELVGRLSRLSVDETRAIPSLDPGRADVILSGAVIAEAALRAVGAGHGVVSEADILDGIAWDIATN